MGATTEADPYVPYLYGPPGFDLTGYFAQFETTYLEHPHYRRVETKFDPLLFGLIYFDKSMVSPETGPDINISQFQVDRYESAKQWVRSFGPAEHRVGLIAPRGAAKSTTTRGCNIWALAHGHRRFLLVLADNDKIAKRYMRNIRRQFANNELLRSDYPGLCTPAKTLGRSVSDTQNQYIAQSGAVIVAAGIDSNELGANVDDMRPDLIVSDDVEPPEGSGYSPYQKQQRLSTLVNGVLPMNTNAVVELCGTVTMRGSITHDLARAAHGEDVQWVREQNFQPRYYHPLPDGRSFWEARYPTPYLESIRNTRYYDLNFLNMPRSHEDGLFEPHHIVVHDDLAVFEHVLWVDPGVTSTRRSDPTGLAVAGLTVGRDAAVEYAEGLRMSPAERKDKVGWLCHENPTIHTVIVETNQGGDEVPTQLRAVVPRGVQVVGFHTPSTEPKPVRFERHLDYHQLGWVHYSADFPTLREQMLDYPKGRHDDVLDAAAGACHYLLKERKRPWDRKAA